MPIRPPLLPSPLPPCLPLCLSRAVSVGRGRPGLWMGVRGAWMLALWLAALPVAVAQGAVAAGVTVAPEAVARAALEAMLQASAPVHGDGPDDGPPQAGAAPAGVGPDSARDHADAQQQTRQLYSDVLWALSAPERLQLRRAQERWQQAAQAQCQALMPSARADATPDGPDVSGGAAAWHDCMARQYRARRAALHHWLMHGQPPDD